MTPPPRPGILGVLNVSPESMVRESIATTPEEVLNRATALLRAGADWIDLGARSITPDAPMIDDASERARLLPALELLKGARATNPEADPTQGARRVSIDTWSPDTAMAALEHGADAVNFTGGTVPDPLLDAIASVDATLFLTFMPYENAYAMRAAAPAETGISAILDDLGPKVEAARRAGIGSVVIDPNLGIIHPSTGDHEKIHRQLEIVWNLDALRELGHPILLYAARKPERLARILLASAILHAGADYVRTHTPEMIVRLGGFASTGKPEMSNASEAGPTGMPPTALRSECS